MNKASTRQPNRKELGLILAAAKMEAGIWGHSIRELPAAIRKLKEEIEAFRTLPQDTGAVAPATQKYNAGSELQAP
jgi:predicted Zn-dependent protease